MNIYTCSKILKNHQLKEIASVQTNIRQQPLPKLKKNMIKSLQIDPPEHFWKIHKN